MSLIRIWHTYLGLLVLGVIVPTVGITGNIAFASNSFSALRTGVMLSWKRSAISESSTSHFGGEM